MKNYISEFKLAMERQVVQHPWVVIAISFVLGYAAGLLF